MMQGVRGQTLLGQPCWACRPMPLYGCGAANTCLVALQSLWRMCPQCAWGSSLLCPALRCLCRAVLRHMARIGDFREGFLTPELVHEFGHLDGVANIRCACRLWQTQPQLSKGRRYTYALSCKGVLAAALHPACMGWRYTEAQQSKGKPAQN